MASGDERNGDDDEGNANDVCLVSVCRPHMDTE